MVRWLCELRRDLFEGATKRRGLLPLAAINRGGEGQMAEGGRVRERHRKGGRRGRMMRDLHVKESDGQEARTRRIQKSPKMLSRGEM